MNATVTPTTGSWERITETPCARGESPFWHAQEQRLYWLDRSAHRVWRWHQASQALEHWEVAGGLTCVAPCRSGGLLLGLKDGLYRSHSWGDVPQALSVAPHPPEALRFSDGKSDPWGRFWTGAVATQRSPALPSAYCLHPLGRTTPPLHPALAGPDSTHALAWSADGRTLYRADAVHREILRHRLHNPGQWPPALGAAEVVARFTDEAQGSPGGLALDRQGRLWVAMVNGGRVLCLDTQGRVLADLPTPAQCPTMLCFGNPDLQTLYLTTARAGRSNAELAQFPGSGCVYGLRVDSPGLPTGFYWD
jgi:sugar lactone lactonase YvrE